MDEEKKLDVIEELKLEMLSIAKVNSNTYGDAARNTMTGTWTSESTSDANKSLLQLIDAELQKFEREAPISLDSDPINF